MTVTRDPPRRPRPADAAPGEDPLARVGRQLIAAEQRHRWRRTRRRVVGGTACGAVLVAAGVAAVLPGGPLGGPWGGEEPTVAGAPAERPLAPSRTKVVMPLDARIEPLQVERLGARLASRLIAAGFRRTAATTSREGAEVRVLTRGGRRMTEEELIRIAGATDRGQLAIYDWEASVLDANGRPIAGRADAAARRVAEAGGGRAGGETARRAQRLADRAGGHVRLFETLGPDAAPGDRTTPAPRYYALRGQPALTGLDVLAGQVTSGGDGAGRPAVRLILQRDARERFHALTRALSQRGQALARPGLSGARAAQHLAITLDHRLLALVAIDPQRQPDGDDGDGGIVLRDGFDDDEAQQLADLLTTALPPMGQVERDG